MDGIPRSDMISELNFIMRLFNIFSPFYAYLINHIIVHLVALLGMFLFTNHYLLPKQNQEANFTLISLGIALAFGVLPFYTMYGLSIAGQPILIYSFLNIANDKGKFTDFLILSAFPLYSFLFLDGVFLILELFLIMLFFAVKRRKSVGKLFLGWLIFSLLFLFVEHDFIQNLLFNADSISQRSVWNLNYLSNSINGVLDNTIAMFIHGQYHAASHHELILLVSLLVLIISYKEIRKNRLILRLLLLQLFIAIIYGFYSWDKIIPIKSLFGIIATFNWGRLYWLSPFIWYYLFFLSLIALSKFLKIGGKKKFSLIFALLMIQIAINVAQNPEYSTYVNRYVIIPNLSTDNITWRQFFSENLFQNIRDAIDLPQADYRVASIGIHPSIAQFNGFYTLDGYQNYYPLSYKLQFRKIIAQELDKSDTWREYFDYWGSRCYIFSSEISDFLSTKEKSRVIKDLDIDIQAFKDLGGRFIFSAAEIINYKENFLHFVGVFEDEDSVWRIYVYETQD